MSFEIPYKTLTPILGEEAPYNPSEETTPKFMNGKFNELLANDKALENQINVLNEKFEVVQCTLLNGWTGEVWCYKSGRMIHFYGRISNGAQENGTIMFEAPFNLALEYFPVFQTTTNPVGWLYSISNQVCVHSLSTNNDLCINITIGGN